MIIINNDTIQEAEQILLPKDCHFDEDRVNFIKRLDSIDLLAVPGSGKTTVLQAKLYCMAKQLPLSNGAGILVLSHTNTAVDEIKHKLKTIVPDLFEYPNDVCTIQEFVDKYLALPFYESYYHNSVSTIDANRYNERVYSYLESVYGNNAVMWTKKNRLNLFLEARFAINGNSYNISKGTNYSEITISSPPKTWQGKIEENTHSIREYIKKMKFSLLKEGILHFDDCYFLANLSIKKNPRIIASLRSRFPFVFVDEAQDLQQHQLDILDLLFNDDTVTYQRIGDPNQAIYNGLAADCIWKPRNYISIKKSLRLGRELSEIVNKLCLDNYQQADGIPSFVVESDIKRQIKPHLILYDEQSVNELKPFFIEIINTYKLKDLPESKYGFHIIGWNADAKQEGYAKYHLKDIFPEYHKKDSNSSTALQYANDYLIIAKTANESERVYRIINELICHAMRIVGIKDKEHDKYFTPKSLQSYLQALNNGSYETLTMATYSAIKSIRNHQVANAIIKKYLIDNLFPLFKVTVLEPINVFFDSKATISDNIEQREFGFDDSIKIGTIHSVKGMTHCATMYVETWYRGHYECEHIKNKDKSPIFKDSHYLKGIYSKQALKMMYVGFSRPTHLLCYASQVQLWSAEDKKKIVEAGWEIRDLTQIDKNNF